ncbi:MAG: radical SAM family heme chaperone HemW [Eubacterium sp.]|nr:radical SAM family heme chaperone HemW [Eubacterium sp.]
MEIYIHIPFCVRKCGYCDFLSFPCGEEMRGRYCRSLIEEIKRTAEAIGSQTADAKRTAEALRKSETNCPGTGQAVETVFFGGGTPSLLAPDQITAVMTCIRSEFSLNEDAEISLEANPGTMDEARLYSWRENGINRLSIGLQSTRDDLLKTLGRIHSFQDFSRNYQLARRAGFDNINIDIMSALPGQTLSDYCDTLKVVTDFCPEHISSYSLIIEEGTPLSRDKRLLDLLPDEETDRKMYEKTKEVLGKKGYGRYEISNYALAGKECRHNRGYWEGVPYLGFGLGAFSYFGHARFSNGTDIHRYLERPYLPFRERADYEEQTREQEMEDRMIFGLRMMKGVSRTKFAEEFGLDLETLYGRQIRKFQEMGLLEISGDRIRLTDAGIDVSNRVFEEFLLEASGQTW